MNPITITVEGNEIVVRWGTQEARFFTVTRALVQARCWLEGEQAYTDGRVSRPMGAPQD